MTTATMGLPDYPNQDGSLYPANIDAAIKVLAEIAAQFAVHESATPGMSVVIDAGVVWTTEQAQQSITGITAPSANPRKDLIELDPLTGTAYLIAGTEAVSPALPSVTTGRVPLAYYQIGVGATAITNSMIVPIRSVPFGAVMRYGYQKLEGKLSLRPTSAGQNSILGLDKEDGTSRSLVYWDQSLDRLYISKYNSGASSIICNIYLDANGFISLNGLNVNVNGNTIGNSFHGRVTSAGASIRLPTGWTVQKNSTGNYSVVHNLGTTNYSALVVLTQIGYASVTNLTNGLSVYTYNSAGTLTDSAFHFQILKD